MLHVADCAISLGFLISFARNVPDGYTSADVVQKIVIPATRDRACRFVELDSVPQAAVGPVAFFISHRWAADFTRELVTLVASHFADSTDAASVEGPAAVVAAPPGPPAVKRNVGEQNQQQLEGAAAVSRHGDAPAADAASPSGVQASIWNSGSSPGSAAVDGGPGAGLGPSSPRNGHEQQHQQPQQLSQPRSLSTQQLLLPMLGSTQHQQQLGTGGSGDGDRSLGRCLSSGGPPAARRSSLSATRGAGAAGAAAAPPQCVSPPWRRPSSSGLAVVPRLSSRLRACREDSGSGDVNGDVNGSSRARSRPSSAGGSGGGDDCPTSAAAAGAVASPFDSSHAAAYAGGGGGGASAAASSLLPGATDADAAADGADFLGLGGNGSFSGSLNPLLARPSGVRHHWPNQQFNSVCSRHSACSVSVSTAGGGGGGGSFSRQGAPTLLQPTVEPGGGGSGGRRDVPPLSPPPLPPPPTASASTSELGVVTAGGAAAAVSRARNTVSGILSYTASRGPSRLASARERASSASSCRQGEPYGGAAAAAAASAAPLTSRVSDSSDAAAADPAAGLVSSSSGSSGNSNSGRGSGGSRRRRGGAAAAGAATNADIADRLMQRFVGRESLLRDTFVWLDMFAINQHPNATQADDLAQLHEVVRRSGRTLVVLDRGGLVLTRIWCLYEIWHTVRRKGAEGLRVLAGPLEHGDLAHVWGELDVERAQATFPADRDRILADIRISTGPEELNRAIKQALVKSASLDLDAARGAAPRTPLHGERAFRAAFLLRTAGSGPAALAAAREAADVFCGCRGPAHPDTLRALRTVAGCHKDLGAARQAVGLLEQQVVPYIEAAYGAHSTESGALDELGMLYYTLGEFDTAYDTLLAALCRRLRQLALTAPTAAATPQLTAALAAGPCAAALAAADAAGRGGGAAAAAGGRVVPPLEPLSGEHLTAVLAAVRALVSELQATELAAASRWPEATPGAASALATPQSSAVGGGGGGGADVVLRGDVGSSVELVGLSLHCLGLVQRERSQRCRSADSGALSREARELMETSVALLKLSSAESRGLAAGDARANLAALAMEGGDVRGAEALLRDNLAATEAVYGRDHPHTATAANNLALCLKRQRWSCPEKAAEAVALYRRCLDVCGRGLGESHPETLVVATNLGVLLADQRQWSESERLLTRAVAGLPPQLGPRHPDVLAAYRRLAEVLELRNKLFEAEAMFRLTLQLAEGVPPEARDHGLVLEAREGLARVQETLEAAEMDRQVSTGCCSLS